MIRWSLTESRARYSSHHTEEGGGRMWWGMRRGRCGKGERRETNWWWGDGADGERGDRMECKEVEVEVERVWTSDKERLHCRIMTAIHFVLRWALRCFFLPFFITLSAPCSQETDAEANCSLWFTWGMLTMLTGWVQRQWREAEEMFVWLWP